MAKGSLQIAYEKLLLEDGELKEKAKELEELLSEYGRHAEGCPAQYDKKYPCKCGWDREKPKPRP